MKHYIDNNIKITIETNASINIDLVESWHKKLVFSMSVKLSNSGENISKRINVNTLNKIIQTSSDSYLKFVVDKEFIPKAREEIDQIIQQIPLCEVYLIATRRYI